MFALVKKHNKGKTEAAAVFKQREHAKMEALQQVADGQLDRSYAKNGEQSRVLIKLRKATLGSEVHFSSIYAKKYFLGQGCYLHFFLTGWHDSSNKSITTSWQCL